LKKTVHDRKTTFKQPLNNLTGSYPTGKLPYMTVTDQTLPYQTVEDR
jgi:hypothetical protein